MAKLPTNKFLFCLKISQEASHLDRLYDACRHSLTINIETNFMPRTLQFGQGNGADFLVLYAENYGNSLDESGKTAPNSGKLHFCAMLVQLLQLTPRSTFLYDRHF